MAGKKLIIIGSGGFGREVLWNAQCAGIYDRFLFVTNAVEEHGAEICGVPVIGDLDAIAAQYEPDNTELIIAIGSPQARRRIVAKLGGAYRFGKVISPDARMSKYVEIGEGSVICCYSILTTQITVGRHSIVNQNISIGHDTVIEDFVTIAPNCAISGYTLLKEACELGSSVVTIPHAVVGRNSVVGAGAVVTKPIPDNVVAVGTPAKPIKELPEPDSV